LDEKLRAPTDLGRETSKSEVSGYEIFDGRSIEHMVDLADRLGAFPSLTEVIFILDCNSVNGADG